MEKSVGVAILLLQQQRTDQPLSVIGSVLDKRVENVEDHGG